MKRFFLRLRTSPLMLALLSLEIAPPPSMRVVKGADFRARQRDRRHANPAPVMSWYDYGYGSADQLDSGMASL